MYQFINQSYDYFFHTFTLFPFLLFVIWVHTHLCWWAKGIVPHVYPLTVERVTQHSAPQTCSSSGRPPGNAMDLSLKTAILVFLFLLDFIKDFYNHRYVCSTRSPFHCSSQSTLRPQHLDSFFVPFLYLGQRLFNSVLPREPSRQNGHFRVLWRYSLLLQRLQTNVCVCALIFPISQIGFFLPLLIFFCSFHDVFVWEPGASEIVNQRVWHEAGSHRSGGGRRVCNRESLRPRVHICIVNVFIFCVIVRLT